MGGGWRPPEGMGRDPVGAERWAEGSGIKGFYPDLPMFSPRSDIFI